MKCKDVMKKMSRTGVFSIYERVKNKQVTLVQLILGILNLPYKIEVTPEY